MAGECRGRDSVCCRCFDFIRLAITLTEKPFEANQVLEWGIETRQIGDR